MKALPSILFVALAYPAFAQVRFVSLTAEPGQSNTVEIAAGETAHMVSSVRIGDFDALGVERDGLRWEWRPSYADLGPVKDPLIVAGPARFTLQSPGTPGAVCTFRVTPDAASPTTAEVVPPGTGGARVELQCSTNLVNWQTATNGIYTNQPAAKFFRIRLDRIPPN